MPIVEFKPQQLTKEQQLADFFARQECQDFKDMFGVFREQCQASFLFDELDFKAIYEGIIADVRSKHFDADGKLNLKTEKEIYNFYDMRLNVEEIYSQYIKNKK